MIIGATAFPVHGYARAALDVDLFIEDSLVDDVWQNRVEDRIGEAPAPFASLDDLIQMKEAAGRPKDVEDLRAPHRLRRKGDHS